MRRPIIAIAATIVGLWLVLAFKSSPLPATDAGRATTPPTTVQSPADNATPTVPSAGPPPPDATPSTPPSTSPTPGATRTVNGSVVSTRYGDVQVAVVLQGNQIVDVKPLQMPFDRSRSQEISDEAGPLLHDEVLQAQSARIDIVSGATYTSDGYARSLQAALDKARG